VNGFLKDSGTNIFLTPLFKHSGPGSSRCTMHIPALRGPLAPANSRWPELQRLTSRGNPAEVLGFVNVMTNTRKTLNAVRNTNSNCYKILIIEETPINRNLNFFKLKKIKKLKEILT